MITRKVPELTLKYKSVGGFDRENARRNGPFPRKSKTHWNSSPAYATLPSIIEQLFRDIIPHIRPGAQYPHCDQCHQF